MLMKHHSLFVRYYTVSFHLAIKLKYSKSILIPVVKLYGTEQ